jgi:hypothetical protein
MKEKQEIDWTTFEDIITLSDEKRATLVKEFGFEEVYAAVEHLREVILRVPEKWDERKFTRLIKELKCYRSKVLWLPDRILRNFDELHSMDDETYAELTAPPIRPFITDDDKKLLREMGIAPFDFGAEE